MSRFDRLQHYVEGAFTPFVREGRISGAIGVALDIAQPAGDFSDPAMDALVLIRATSPGARYGCDFGAGHFSGLTAPDQLFTPVPGIASRIVLDDPHTIRMFAFPLAKLRRTVEALDLGGAALDDFGPLHARPTKSRRTVQILDFLWSNAHADEISTRLSVEAAVLELVSELWRLGATPTAPLRGGLPPRALRLVEAYIADSFDRDPSLAELAAVAGLSPAHFCRAYKQSTGTTPGRALIARRIERAQELLVDSDLPIIEVAAACGYESPSAFSTVFRRSTGLTPRDYRRERTR